MVWFHENDLDNIRAPKTNLKWHKKRNIFEQNSAKIYYEHRFFLFQKKHWRVLILAVLIAVLSFAYYYNTMDVFVASSLEEDDDIRHILFTTTAKTSISRLSIILSSSRPAETTKVLASERSTRSAQSTKVKSAPSLQNPRVKSASKMTAKGSPPTPPKLSRATTPRNKTSPNPTSDTNCRMFSCFNYSRCPLTGSFSIYLYDLDVLYNGIVGITAPIKEMLSVNNYITSDPEEACLFLVIGELPYEGREETEISSQSYKLINEATLNTLPHWGCDGRNHLLLNLGYGAFTKMTGSAIVAQTLFTHKQFRPGFDVVMSASQAFVPLRGEVWSSSPSMKLARRKILLSFRGQELSEMTPKNAEHDRLAKVLQDLEWVGPNNYHLHFLCNKVDKLSENGIDDWALCLKRQSRRSTLRKSTFALILAPSDYTYASTNLLQIRLYEALESGAIPVILGGDRIRLPFEEVLDWRRAVISLPTARVTDLKFLLESMADEDILAFRKHGRMLWERYLGTVQASVDSLLAVIRTRLNIAPQPAKFGNVSMFEFSFPEVRHGNRPPNIQSNSYRRNFTVGLLNAYEQWNLWGDPFALHPQLPWDPILTPEARFLNESAAMQFHDACRHQAGDRPLEQFTAVILTYDRKAKLDKAITKLSQMLYINKILVINNGPSKLAREDWPTTVPIVVVQASENSVNNRFVPYDMIETEAVLSLDDDAVLQTKEIRFAFKVWRQHRDQIVGFFGRNIEWDSERKVKGFRYSTKDKNSGNRFCQIYMVLTGAAFIHRYYFWAYWHVLPQSMRDLVDKYNNCEDLAMNFLVAHIAKKPPIKVNWGEPIDTSYTKLSRNNSHYSARNKCMKYFAKVMGYTPLVTTHYRVKPLPSVQKI